MKVLICDADQEFSSKLEESLKKDFEIKIVGNGRDAQASLSAELFHFTIMNIELSSFSAFEVIKFINFKSIKTIIFLVSNNPKLLEDYGINSKSLEQMGVFKTFFRPFSLGTLESEMKNAVSFKSWKKLDPYVGDFLEEEIKALDDKFTFIEIENFFCGKVVIFDVFVRAGKNTYIKIFNKGEAINPDRIEEYSKKTNTKVLYFKTAERKEYINFMNDVIKIANRKDSITPQTRMKFLKSTAIKLVEEVYASGINRRVLEETLFLCEGINKTISQAPELRVLMSECFELDDNLENHAYLSAIYSDIISQNTIWVTEHSRPKIIMGALLQNLGKIKLQKEIKGKKFDELSPSELSEYKKHPEHGVSLLNRIPEINEQVKQIVHQHHELINGMGYPLGLHGSKIYPLAKIVGFAGYMAELSLVWKLAPLDVMRKIMKEKKEELRSYDPSVIQSFLKSLAPKAPENPNKTKGKK